jgi:signal transduction histidine kinase
MAEPALTGVDPPTTLRAATQSAVTQSATTERDRDLRVLSGAVALLKASDLASALPAFLEEVGPELGLDDLVITRIEDDQAGVFDQWRVRARAGGRHQHNLGVAPGTEISFPLVRGEHLLGELRARARAGLSPSDIATVERLCDLLAVAMDGDRMLRREQETVAALRELDELKTTFLGSVSHDLRTTVTIIEGFAMLLSRQWDDLTGAQRAEFVERIWTSARSLGSLIEDLLDLARLDKTAAALPLQVLDLTELVPKIVTHLSTLLGHHLVSVAVAPHVATCGDPVALERILVNLLSNATKYTPPGTLIEVSLSVQNGDAVLRVADHGPGIPRPERDRVFERFYRGSRGANSAARGLGIGLALVHDLVEQQQGRITLSETCGGGATFEVTFATAAPVPTSCPGRQDTSGLSPK